MANPALNEKIFRRVDSVIVDSDKMSINGTINKTGFLLLFMVLGAMFGWNSNSGVLIFGSVIVSLILCFAIMFGPQRAAYLSQIYAVTEGVLLGSISSMYAAQYPGIVSNALMLTMSCLFVTLALYRFKIVRVNDRFRTVLTVAMGAIFLTYLVSMIMGFFGSALPMIHQSSPLGIGFSLVVVVVAASNLFLDFDLVEQASQRGSPKYMEWYCGFALIITLVWLYMEILRLLGKLNKR